MLKNIWEHPKTTVGGLITIVAAIAPLFGVHIDGCTTGADPIITVVGALAGMGLMVTRDPAKST